MRKTIDVKGNVVMVREESDDIIATLAQENEKLRQACIHALVFVCDNGEHCSSDIEFILKEVLGKEWRDYK